MKLKSMAALEEFGRIRLSRSFFMRDFLYSEIANFYGVANLPDSPDLAVEVGKRLCEDLLEPLNSTFGRIAIRSAYRSPEVNALGNEKGHSCASNEKNYAGHIWDHLDAQGRSMVCGSLYGWGRLEVAGVLDSRSSPLQQAAILPEARRVQHNLA